jgi:hypothetical protein
MHTRTVYAVAAALAAVLVATTSALAGSGVGGVFNLGQVNTVDAQTSLTGNPGESPLLKATTLGTAAAVRGVATTGIGTNGISTSGVGQQGFSNSGIGTLGTHGNTTGISPGVQGETNSTDPNGAGVVGKNNGGGPALRAIVNAAAAPLAVNSSVKVANLNADLLDGLDSPAFQKRVSGTCGTGSAIKSVDVQGTVACEPVGGGGVWSLKGNAGTAPGTNFLGTTDNQALELKVNGQTAFRLEPNATSPNVIGGFSGNGTSTATPHGVTIAGGGVFGLENLVTDDFGTVGGGGNNTASGAYSAVAGGKDNTAPGDNSTVVGGDANLASGNWSAVAGGAHNTASGIYSAVAGGQGNTASGANSTVAGGEGNTASGAKSIVAGGEGNTASGAFTFAAGLPREGRPGWLVRLGRHHARPGQFPGSGHVHRPRLGRDLVRHDLEPLDRSRQLHQHLDRRLPVQRWRVDEQLRPGEEARLPAPRQALPARAVGAHAGHELELQGRAALDAPHRPDGAELLQGLQARTRQQAHHHDRRGRRCARCDPGPVPSEPGARAAEPVAECSALKARGDGGEAHAIGKRPGSNPWPKLFSRREEHRLAATRLFAAARRPEHRPPRVCPLDPVDLSHAARLHAYPTGPVDGGVKVPERT